MYLIGRSARMNLKYIKTNIGHPIAMDNSKSKKTLKIDYIPLEKTVEDMVNQLIAFKLVK